jgi:hypothetical protein
MIEAPMIPAFASLTPAMVRRRPLVRLIEPMRGLIETGTAVTGSGWQADLRFFLTCYAAGLLFVVVMLS